MKRLLLIITICTSSLSFGQTSEYCDSILIDSFTMTFSSQFDHPTPIFDASKTYRMFVVGRYGIADGWSGIDPAYNYVWDTITNTKVNCDGTQDAQEYIAWLFNGVENFARPDNNEHNNCCFCDGIDKVFFWTLTGLSGSQMISFTDVAWGDNSGSLNFEIYEMDPMPLSSITQSDVTLTADQNNATYQWIDCDNNNSPISGETNQSYTPTVTGNYAVEVTVNGCTSVSECVLVDFTGVDELLNPTTKKLIKIVNLLGQEVEYTPNTVLIYQYSDGTSEKVFTIED